MAILHYTDGVEKKYIFNFNWPAMLNAYCRLKFAIIRFIQINLLCTQTKIFFKHFYFMLNGERTCLPPFFFS